MSDAAKKELAELVEAAVRKAMENHPCRFDDSEAKALHQMADHLDLSQLRTLAMVASAINSVGARVGQAMAWGLLAAILGALVALVRLGLLPTGE